MKPIIFLDRDGTLNRDFGYVSSPNEFEWIPGVIESMRSLTSLGYDLVIVSNQSGIARQKYKWLDLLYLERWMHQSLKHAGVDILGYWYCPHHPDYTGRCLCRKPSARLLNLALEKYAAEEKDCWMVGDSLRDLRAGKAAGVRSAGILTGKAPDDLRQSEFPLFNTLDQFVDFLRSE